MDQRTEVVFIAIAFALLAGIMTWLFFRYRRSKELRERFGPEYDRVVRKEGNVKRGEGVLRFAKRNATRFAHPSSFFRKPAGILGSLECCAGAVRR